MQFTSEQSTAIVAIIVCLCNCWRPCDVAAVGSTNDANKLLLVLLDGFRWDYIDKYDLLGFKKIRQRGVSAEQFVPVFSSLSYVNYYSIMTGVYAETHGQVDNYMYDVIHDTEFVIGKNKDQYNSYWWDDAEPLWITAVRQGKRSYFWHWCGCEVEIRGRRPTFCLPYFNMPDPSIETFSRSLDSAVEVLRNGSADLAGVYFERVDSTAHRFGPNSDKTRDILQRVDYELLRVLEAVEAHGMNLMIFSDHGMAERIGGPTDSRSGLINVLDYVSESDWEHVAGSSEGPILQIWPKAGKLNSMYNALRNANPNLKAYLKHDIPEQYHLKNHYRVPPLYLVADMGYAIVRNSLKRQLGYVANHGYDTRNVDMAGILLAGGPDFRNDVVLRQRRLVNVEAYQLMCHVMKLEPQPHNGSWSNICDALADESACANGVYKMSSMPSVATEIRSAYLAILLLLCVTLWFTVV